MFFQMLQPFILIQRLHMGPASVNQLLHILIRCQMRNLAGNLFFHFLFCLRTKCPDKFLHPVICPLPGGAFFNIVHTALQRIRTTYPHILKCNMDGSAHAAFLHHIPESESAQLFVHLRNMFRHIKPDTFFFQGAIKPLQTVCRRNINTPDASRI
jgi:hypothetical protein